MAGKGLSFSNGNPARNLYYMRLQRRRVIDLNKRPEGWAFRTLLLKIAWIGLGPNVSGATRFESIEVVCAACARINLSDCADLNRINTPCVVIYAAQAANLCPIDPKCESPIICTRKGRGAPVQLEEVGNITNI